MISLLASVGVYFQFVVAPSQGRIKEFSIVAMNFKFEVSGTGVEYVTLEYLDQKVNTPVMRVNKDDIVRLKITSVDTLHGISIEGYGINKPFPPSKTIIVEFVAEVVGEFHIHCSIYCGEGHNLMHALLTVA